MIMNRTWLTYSLPLLALAMAAHVSYAQMLPPTAPAAPAASVPAPAPNPMALPPAAMAPALPPVNAMTRGAQAGASNATTLPLMPGNAGQPAIAPLAPGGVPALPPGSAAPTSDVALDAQGQPIPVTSMGPSNMSLFFTPNQIRALRDALVIAETKGAALPAGELTVEAAAPKKVEDPAVYPVFYLSSIAYQAPHDWSIWISGRKITSTKNTTTLKILSISPDHVLLSWQPTYNEALKIRSDKSLFTSPDALKNKLTHPQNITYDDKNGVITFDLHANQSFVLGYFAIFEGFVASPAMTPLPEEKAKEVNTKASENDLSGDTKAALTGPAAIAAKMSGAQMMPSSIPSLTH